MVRYSYFGEYLNVAYELSLVSASSELLKSFFVHVCIALCVFSAILKEGFILHARFTDENNLNERLKYWISIFNEIWLPKALTYS